MLKSFPKPQKYTHKINMLYFHMHPKVFPKRKLKIFHVFPKEKKGHFLSEVSFPPYIKFLLIFQEHLNLLYR